MAANPQIPQGTLNRLRGSAIIPDHPELNVTASFLGEAGITLSPEGPVGVSLPTMTGTVRSPEPYQMMSISVNLLKTQSLANLYKARLENDCSLGDITIKSDASTLDDYIIRNCQIISVAAISMAGKDAGWNVTLQGFYQINSSLFSVA